MLDFVLMDIEEIVHGFVDSALGQLLRNDLMYTPDPNLPPPMRVSSRPTENDWRGWKAIPSTVTEEDLNELEGITRLRFPPSYRVLLRYKHYYGLTGAGVRFEQHLIGRWKADLLDSYDAWHPERIVKVGLLPFGSETFMDAGPVCFDTRVELEGGEYPVVFWDHEWIETEKEVRPMFSNSLKMFEALRYVAEKDVNFFYRDDTDAPRLLSRKAELLKGFLSIDRDGVGGIAKDYWTAWGVAPEI